MDDFFIPEKTNDTACHEDPATMVDPVNTNSQEPAAAAIIDIDLENGIMGTDYDVTRSRMIKLSGWQTAAPNGCAICLCEYQPGDVLVWSSNRSSCRHVYHQDCLLEYFLTKGGGDDGHSSLLTIPPCPMCRQAFIVLQTKNKQEENATAET